MGIGPIPYSAIRLFADEYDIVSRDEFDFFLGIIRGLDAEYLTLINSTKDTKTEMVAISDIPEQHRMFARLKARAQKR